MKIQDKQANQTFPTSKNNYQDSQAIASKILRVTRAMHINRQTPYLFGQMGECRYSVYSLNPP